MTLKVTQAQTNPPVFGAPVGVVCHPIGKDLLRSTYLPNLVSISPIMKMWKAVQNVEIGVFWSSQGHQQ